jgi:hypothetical protein
LKIRVTLFDKLRVNGRSKTRNVSAKPYCKKSIGGIKYQTAYHIRQGAKNGLSIDRRPENVEKDGA